MSQAVDEQIITKLGQLARINLKPVAIQQLQAEIGSILDYVEQLQSVDTGQLRPTSQVTGLNDVWREDKPYERPWSRTELLKNAPATQDGYLKVKRVI